MKKVKPIRVLFARMPNLLTDILSCMVASEPDMIIGGRLREGEDVQAAIRRTRSNVIVVGESADDARREYGLLLMRRPKIKVLAICGDGRTGLLYELRPKRIPLGEMSADTLREAIRGRAKSNTDAEA
jgi:hypothetical protein